MKQAHSPLLKHRDSRGAVIVEFALTLPFLVLILLLIVDLSWVLRENQILENAAREGARVSILQPAPTVAQVQQVVIQYCSQENITVLASDITVDQAAPIDIGGVIDYGSQVTVTYQRPFLIPATGLLPGGQMTLVGQALFRNLY